MTYPQDPASQPQQPQYTDGQQPGGYYQQPQAGTEYPTGPYQAPPTGQFTGPANYAAAGPAQPSFFTALFDFSFRSFATPTLLQITYVVSLVMIGLSYLVSVIVGFATYPVFGIAILLIGAPGVALSVLLTRMFLEYLAVIFRINENIAEINTRGKGV
ncbi:DUF4282 domain-containing protein [Phytomonospora sp. NPDC050363]|uniref:DUF4282 domain-containing protein n=1 Tax=Phytomonospora sp. NPDC050363 TaxID=3155642 RepID=UPI0033F7C89B